MYTQFIYKSKKEKLNNEAEMKDHTLDQLIITIYEVSQIYPKYKVD